MSEAVAELNVSQSAQKAIDDLLKLSEEDRSVVFMKVLEKTSILGALGLVKLCETHWGVSAAAPVAAVAAPAAQDSKEEVAEEKTSFNVVLVSGGDKKIQVIKEVRALTGLSLKDAKDLVDGAPKPLKEGVDKEEAEKIRTVIEAAGGVIEIK